MRTHITKLKAEVRANKGETTQSTGTSPLESDNSKTPTDEVLGVEYTAFGDGYGWMSQPGMFNNNQYNMEMGVAGQGVMGNDMMGQSNDWNMWDDFMQPSGTGFDGQIGEQRSW